MINLRGIAFDHPRSWAPLRATADQFSSRHPEIEISWDARSLKDFEDYPIEKLVRKYDLVILDHPFIGTAADKELLVPLDEHVSAEYLADQEKNSVGPSHSSYSWGGHQWALAVDAAAQVSAYRPDLITDMGLEVPATWDDVFELTDALPESSEICLPLNPTHSYCSFVTLGANLGADGFWDEAEGIDPWVGEEALELLRRLAGLAHESSLELDPIQTLDLMSRGQEVAYAPLIFGYSNYARPRFAPHVVRFADIPSAREEPAGSILGGVGLAVSAFSKHGQAALRYALCVAAEGCQKGLYFSSGGQPGHRAAWSDTEVNLQSNGFFQSTLRTLDLAYLRPRYPSYPNFQEQAGHIVHRFLEDREKASNTIGALNRLHSLQKGRQADEPPYLRRPS
jgi:multiple sugar transport system substrate-binding protein